MGRGELRRDATRDGIYTNMALYEQDKRTYTERELYDAWTVRVSVNVSNAAYAGLFLCEASKAPSKSVDFVLVS